MTTGLLLAVIIIAAVLLWLIPMDPTLRKILIAMVMVAFVFWLLNLVGVLHLGGGRVIVTD